jgi:hypothetical protein
VQEAGARTAKGLNLRVNKLTAFQLASHFRSGEQLGNGRHGDLSTKNKDPGTAQNHGAYEARAKKLTWDNLQRSRPLIVEYRRTKILHPVLPPLSLLSLLS